MPRQARVVVPGIAHHVTQRGNNRQDVFFTDDDRQAYLESLKRQSEKFGLKVHGYCLMTNHIHLLATPSEPDSLAKTLGSTHLAYSQYINRLHGRSGHLWQNRFFSCPTDSRYFLIAMQYIERNPIRAKLVRVGWRYPWSSAAAHCGEPDRSRLLNLREWRRRIQGNNWRSVLSEREVHEEIEQIRRCTFNGRPLASDRFISKLESTLNRRLRPNPVGRPRKRKDQKRKGKSTHRKR